MGNAVSVASQSIFDVSKVKPKSAAYWLVTGFLVFVLFSGAIGEFTRNWGTIETVTILGYPSYFLTLIALWKILGSIALIIPGYSRLKEWAYAGIFFNMTGAAISHIAVGDYGAGGYHVIVTLGITILAMISWALRPSKRVLSAPIH